MKRPATPGTLRAFLTLAALLGLLVAGAGDGLAQDKKKKGKGEPTAPGSGGAGDALVATLVLDNGRTRDDVELREVKFAKLKFREKGAAAELEGEKVVEIRLKTAPAGYLSGVSQVRGGVYDRAVQSFTAVRNGAAEGGTLWAFSTYWLAESQRLVGNPAEAQAEAQRLLDKAPDHWLAPGAILILGQAQAAAGGAAEATFKRLETGFGELWTLRGKLADAEAKLEKKQWGPARGAFEVVQAGANRFPSIKRAAQVGIGRCYVGDKRFDDAVKFFEGIIGNQDNDAEVAGGAWLGIGDCKYEAARAANNDAAKLKEALIAYQVVVVRYAGVQSCYPKALYQSGELYRALNLPDLGKRMDDELTARCPRSDWAARRKRP